MVLKPIHSLWRIVWFLGLMCLGCSTNQNNELAKFRIGQFLYTSKSATIEIFRDHVLVDSITTGYGELTNYYKIPPRPYLIKVKADGQLILEKNIGFGRSGIYTLALTGLPVKNQLVNKRSTIDKLTHMVEGAAALTTNDFLPQLIIQNDFAVNDPGNAKIRAAHIMPGTIPLDLKILKENEPVLSYSGIKYPQTTETKSLRPHKYMLELKLTSSEVSNFSKLLNLEERTLYTLYFIPSPKDYNSNLMMIVGKTKIPFN